MKESSIVAKIQNAVDAAIPGVWVRKIADRFTRGLPDLLIRYRWRVLFVEVKRPGDGAESALQTYERERCNADGGVWLLVTDAVDVLAVLRYWQWLDSGNPRDRRFEVVDMKFRKSLKEGRLQYACAQ